MSPNNAATVLVVILVVGTHLTLGLLRAPRRYTPLPRIVRWRPRTQARRSYGDVGLYDGPAQSTGRVVSKHRARAGSSGSNVHRRPALTGSTGVGLDADRTEELTLVLTTGK